MKTSVKKRVERKTGGQYESADDVCQKPWRKDAWKRDPPVVKTIQDHVAKKGTRRFPCS
jgi:hypothetical protein